MFELFFATGHASLIGSITGKVTEFDLRTRSCSICQYHKGRGGSIPTHECNTNWTGNLKLELFKIKAVQKT